MSALTNMDCRNMITWAKRLIQVAFGRCGYSITKIAITKQTTELNPPTTEKLVNMSKDKEQGRLKPDEKEIDGSLLAAQINEGVNSMEIEDRLLTTQINDMRERLELIHYKRGKLSRERTNELSVAHWRKRDFIPGNLYLQITNECNLRCVMCPNKTATKDHSFMDETLFRRVLDQASEHKIDNIVFAAAYGEALLHPNAIQYLRESIARGFQVTVATNGNFLEADEIEELASLNLELFQYSFFGFDKASYEKTYVGGSFEKASENLRLFKAAMLRVGGNMKLTVNGVNIVNDPDRTRKTRLFLTSIGIEESEMRLQMPCNVGGVFSEKIGGRSFKPVDRLPLYVCPLLLSTPGILVDGRMTACGCVDNNGSLVIGDIRTNTIAQIRLGGQYQSMIDAFIIGDLRKFPMCAKCDIPYGNITGEYNNTAAVE